MISIRASRISTIAILLIVGCGPGADDMSKERLASMAGGALKDVVPVSGKVLVDGEPKGGISLYLYPTNGGTQIMDCQTKPDGTYCWTTHAPCDGIEPGEYMVAFRYVQKKREDDDSDEAANDVFKSRYSNPRKLDYKLTVVKGSPQTEVNYELKMK